MCHALQQGWHGLENLALIPGTVGAAPVQNIGAYGVELASVCAYVEAFNWQSGEVERIAAADCRFGYRDSIFKHDYQDSHFITAVGLRLPKAWQPVIGYGPLAALGEHPGAQAIFDTVCATRMAKLPDPAVLGNAGSFFKNPVVDAATADALKAGHPALPVFAGPDGGHKLSAAWLIEACGWKGKREGDAGVAEPHALVLVNHGQATGEQLLDLARRIAASVRERFGVSLEPEPRIIGARFDPA